MVEADELPVGPPPALSKEIFSIPVEDGHYIIYAPLRRSAFVANAKVVNFLADLGDGVYDRAADPDGTLLEFLRELQIVDGGDEPLPVHDFVGEPAPSAVTLFLTTACNLRCTYCYASAGDTPTKFMALEVAKRGIDFVAANAVKQGRNQFEVMFHGGGEPTVNWKTMTAAMDYARQKAGELGLSVRATSATNGVLTDAQIDWVIANLSAVSLSFDGLPSVQDLNRPTTTGKGSSDRVMHTMRRFDQAGFRYGLRMTVTADQIERLPDSVEFICANFAVGGIKVEPSYQLGRWSEAPNAETSAFIEAYRAAKARADSYGRRLSYSAVRLDTLTSHFCGITQDSFCLSPDGNVSACYENFSEDNKWANVFFYGRPDDKSAGYRFDMEKLTNLRRQTVTHKPYCQGCFAKWHCAGDCHHKALAVGGTAEFAGSDRCHITREITKDQILARIAQSGGVFWHEAGQRGAYQPTQGKESMT
jgi:uncharacterized protein